MVIDYGDGRRVQAINLCFEARARRARRGDDAARDARHRASSTPRALPEPFVPIHEIRVQDAERGGDAVAVR